ncbi:MAG TPA: tyrosine phenol-lyase, partial [Bacteroidetes bacterium]|nr:tyrosine phenol-lyase [Bacteroidota bacterium]
FKGNVDLQKLEDLVKKVGAAKVPYISVAGTVNMAGGQPFSIENLRQVHAFCKKNGIRVILDATRMVENAYFNKIREKGYQDKSIAEILREICSLSDGCTMSGKKDLLVNIGGFLALQEHEREVFEEARNMVVIYEGLHTYGGLAGRDMEAMSRGIEEAVNLDHIRARVGQIEYVGEKLLSIGVPIVQPIGGHAIFLDAKQFLPQLKQIEFPAQTLAAELYLDSGIRAMERGIVSAGRNKQTGDHYYPKLELVRLTFPRRVYTQAHCDVTAESVEAVYETRKAVKGLKLVYEPKYLRFFQARFERLR